MLFDSSQMRFLPAWRCRGRVTRNEQKMSAEALFSYTYIRAKWTSQAISSSSAPLVPRFQLTTMGNVLNFRFGSGFDSSRSSLKLVVVVTAWPSRLRRFPVRIQSQGVIVIWLWRLDWRVPYGTPDTPITWKRIPNDIALLHVESRGYAHTLWFTVFMSNWGVFTIEIEIGFDSFTSLFQPCISRWNIRRDAWSWLCSQNSILWSQKPSPAPKKRIENVVRWMWTLPFSCIPFLPAHFSCFWPVIHKCAWVVVKMGGGCGMWK